MREGPDVLVNAMAGERVVFHRHADDTDGQVVSFDMILTKVGTVHRWWNAGPGDALVTVELRPALHFEQLLDEAFRLVDEGKFGEHGPIDLVATQEWAERWRDEYRLAQ